MQDRYLAGRVQRLRKILKEATSVVDAMASGGIVPKFQASNRWTMSRLCNDLDWHAAFKPLSPPFRLLCLSLPHLSSRPTAGAAAMAPVGSPAAAAATAATLASRKLLEGPVTWGFAGWCMAGGGAKVGGKGMQGQAHGALQMHQGSVQ